MKLGSSLGGEKIQWRLIERDTCDEKVLRVVRHRSGMFMQIRVLADRNGIQRKIRFTY